ncbi:translocase of chloroplast 120, chloroplastic-like isoform X1 [Alnus glutinosa]|uniref:translocase of chloroplast 120, chloroplastic-like isoform X1 n=1 Tax=Alnus glutinosa TaxID=3517 RepID=UPI002D767C46|nr:translocase of chloroplast 120, chloroplastic-like isoform X1 [Alnus glutinosa]
MENGVEIVDGSQAGEESVEVEVSEEIIEERVVVGSDESKDLYGEEVFDDAMSTLKLLQEQVAEPDSGYGVSCGGGGNVELIPESVLQAVDENPNAGHEVEKFEEAAQFFEASVIIEDKVDDLVGGKSVDGSVVVDEIDEGGNEKVAETDELNGSRDHGGFDGGENGGEEVSEVGTGGEKEVLKGEDEVEFKSGLVVENSENKVFDHVNLEHIPVDEKLENGGGDKVGGVFVESLQKTELHREILNEDGNGEKLKGDNLDTECQDNESREFKDARAGIFSSHEDDSSDEARVISSHMDTEHQDCRNGEAKDTQAGVDSERHVEPCELKDTSVDLHTFVEESPVVSVIGSSPAAELSRTENTEKFQDNTTDMKAEDHEVSEHKRADENDHEVLNNHTVAEETMMKEENVGQEKQRTQVNGEQEIQPAPELASSHGKSTNPAPPPARPAGLGPLLAEETMTKEENAGQEKQKTRVNGEQEIQPAPELASSHGKSANPAPPPARPAGLGRAAPLLAEENMTKEENAGQEKQKTRVNGEQEIQRAPELASSHGKSANPAPPPARPAGLGRAAPLLEPAPRVAQQARVNGNVSQMQTQQIEDPINGEAEEYDETREKLQMIRVKFLRLAHRLGQTPHNVVVAQVLYRLGLAEQLRGRNGGRVGAFSFDRASAMAEQLEAAGQEPLDFSCTIMVLGKTGVGKSATINSIFDEVKFSTDAFQMGTKKVQDVVGTVQGIKVRVIDTPGLLPSLSDQRQNEKILLSVKRFIKTTPPDIVLYLDRLDMQSRDFSDMPLLRTITEIFGPSIWFNAIVVLTHAASAPPDGPNGTASSYDMFVTQRSHVVQQAIRQAAGDMRLMNPVSLVENHSACRTNRAGQRVLPNGQVWKPHLLLLSFASKILAEANTLLKLQDSPPGKPFPNRTRAPPLPFLLSSLLQSRPQLKMPEEQFGDEDDLDDDLDESSDSDEESEFDELPPFKRLTKAQEARLTKAQKKAYYDELEYREKVFMKKQLKEEKKRRKMMKKMAASAKDQPSDFSENVEEESGGAASVPVPLPDYALPASFDSDNPCHRYRHLDSSNQWLIRPVLDTHGWDHDVGYEGINVERLFVVKDKIPLSFSGQVTKDKKDANVQLEVASSIKHGEGKATSLGFDMQTVGKDLAYTLRSETRFSNFRKNKATAGLSVTLLGDALSAGLKLEDKLIANKRFRLVMTGGAMTARGDVAYGGSLEAQLRDKDYPLGRSLSTLGLSVMDWHGDPAIGCNIQSQIPIGRSSNLIGRINLNNRGAGQVSIRLNSSEQIQIALVSLIPLLRKLHGHFEQLQSSQ